MPGRNRWRRCSHAAPDCSGPHHGLPDAKTIWDFRQRIGQDGRQGAPRVFEASGKPLESQGLIAREGSIIGARWAKKNHETHYGYKNHVKADLESKLIIRSGPPPRQRA